MTMPQYGGYSNGPGLRGLRQRLSAWPDGYGQSPARLRDPFCRGLPSHPGVKRSALSPHQARLLGVRDQVIQDSLQSKEAPIGSACHPKNQ